MIVAIAIFACVIASVAVIYALIEIIGSIRSWLRYRRIMRGGSGGVTRK